MAPFAVQTQAAVPPAAGQAVGTPTGGVVADAERARKINALRAVEVLNSLKNGLAEGAGNSA